MSCRGHCLTGYVTPSSDCSLPHCRSPVLSLEGRLDGLPLRVSNEGHPRPRVARAQETI